MAITVRRADGVAMQIAIATAHNLSQAAASNVGTSFHADVVSTTTTDAFTTTSAAALQVSATNGVDLPTSIALANQLLGTAKVHVADGISASIVKCGAHKIPDATATTALAALVLSVDLPTAITLANGIKAALNTHFTQALVHFTNDATNTIAAANATDLPSLQTLVNAMKTSLNAHILSAPGSTMVQVVNA